MVQAFANLGHPLNPDYNGEQQLGVGYTQLNVKEDGRRLDAFSAVLAPSVGDPRLSILMGSRVKRLALNGKKAEGVVLDQDGVEKTLKASREIIVCAGTLHTAPSEPRHGEAALGGLPGRPAH